MQQFELLNDQNPLLLILLGCMFGMLLVWILSLKNKTKIHDLQTKLAVLEEKIKFLQNKDAEAQQFQDQLLISQTENAQLKAKMEEQLKGGSEKIRLLQEAEQQLKIQFENLANKIFHERSREFKDQNKHSLNEIVNPLKEQLGDFKKKIETVYDSENRDRISLREEIASLRRETANMNREALNLTRALKGDKKIQGNWGEMILEKVLEQSGLRKGIEYETQGAFRDEEKKLYKPDVIVRLPEDKDVVIDSKVSLLAYEQYSSTEDDKERSVALRQHIESVRNHIRSLSDKDYSSLKGLRSLDFVLLFMPIESAFIEAFQGDEKLFNEAFERKIIVVTPTTLLATLRTIENIWRYERQNENARIIAEKAGSIYDKVRGLVEDLEKMGNQLATVHKTYDGVMNKLTLGNGNLIRQTSSFVDLGVKVKKTLPKSIIEKAGSEDDV